MKFNVVVVCLSLSLSRRCTAMSTQHNSNYSIYILFLFYHYISAEGNDIRQTNVPDIRIQVV